MARIDKYNPVGGGTRAAIAADFAGSATALGVGLDVNGRVVVGAGQSGIVGVLCLPRAVKAADIVDVMKHGEIVEFAGAAGTVYTANTTTGVISSAAASGTQIRVGHTVEATRLVVGVL